jgi:hypothetical protein
MILKCHVSDRCNFRCPDCHWFSEGVDVRDPPVGALLPIIRSPEWSEVDFTGGEPTLWEPLAEAINTVPIEKRVGVFTNGSHPEALVAIARSVWILLSIHPETDWDAARELLDLAAGRQWAVSSVRFPEDTAVPKWFPLWARPLTNQITDGAKFSGLLGKTVRCVPRTALLGTDGHFYACERGLRSKDPALRGRFMETCRVGAGCLSAFIGEQRVTEAK